jgi:HAD superfamily hydrolase (TIGR01509 family)
MDGVLIHSNPWHARVWLEFCRERSIPVPPDQIECMYGRRNDEIVKAWSSEDLTEAEILRLGHEKEALFRRRMQGRLRESAVPGLHEFLRRYNAYPAAVASNAEMENIEFVLGELGLDCRFQAIVSGDEVRWPKPDPQIYLLAAERLGCPPAECLAFEDSAAGVRSARAAGMRVVGLSTTTPDLPGAELVVEDFRAPRLHRFLASVAAPVPAEGAVRP